MIFKYTFQLQHLLSIKAIHVISHWTCVFGSSIDSLDSELNSFPSVLGI